MQTKNQAKKAPAIAANSKETQLKKVKQSYTFINVRVTPETKAAMNKLAKSRKLSLSKAVEYLIEYEIHNQDEPVRAESRDPLTVDPTITLTPDEIEAYEKPQWLQAGKPVTRDPWFVRLLNHFFGR